MENVAKTLKIKQQKEELKSKKKRREKYKADQISVNFENSRRKK